MTAIRRIIQTRSGYVNILVTGREEQDIKNSLEYVISDTVSLECGGLDKDIKCYIQKCLENDSDWKACEQAIKEEIQDALVKGAHGM